MKELSIKQKAKAYDEALERAKKVHKYSSDIAEIKRMEILFPELAESKDEKVRKAIIKSIMDLNTDWLELHGVTKKNALAWLEKQTNTIPNECVFRPLAGTDIKSAAKQAIEQQGVLAKEIVLAFNGAYIPVKGKAQDIIVNEYNSWLEKQGEPNQHLELKAGNWYICHRAYCCRADHLTVKEGERFQCEKDGIVKGFVVKEPEKYFKECSAPATTECNYIGSDDVRRRSTIQVLEYARSLDAYNQYGKADIDKNIAWLEEQGNPNKDYWKGYKDGKKAILDRYSELKKQDKQKQKKNKP